jgi:predicted nucleotidyltransferase
MGGAGNASRSCADATAAVTAWPARLCSVSEQVTVIRRPARHTLADLAALARPRLEAAGAERAVVFGSWARGTADGFSDIDLAVVIDTPLPPFERGRLLRGVVEALPVGVDVLIYTPAEFARGLEERFGIFDAIVREGVTIYARSGA